MLYRARRVGFGESAPRHHFPDFPLRNGSKWGRFRYPDRADSLGER